MFVALRGNVAGFHGKVALAPRPWVWAARASGIPGKGSDEGCRTPLGARALCFIGTASRAWRRLPRLTPGLFCSGEGRSPPSCFFPCPLTAFEVRLLAPQLRWEHELPEGALERLVARRGWRGGLAPPAAGRVSRGRDGAEGEGAATRCARRAGPGGAPAPFWLHVSSRSGLLGRAGPTPARWALCNFFPF